MLCWSPDGGYFWRARDSVLYPFADWQSNPDKYINNPTSTPNEVQLHRTSQFAKAESSALLESSSRWNVCCSIAFDNFFFRWKAYLAYCGRWPLHQTYLAFFYVITVLRSFKTSPLSFTWFVTQHDGVLWEWAARQDFNETKCKERESIFTLGTGSKVLQGSDAQFVSLYFVEGSTLR